MSQSPRHLLEGSLGTGVRAGLGGAGASFLTGTAGPSAPHLLEVSSNPTAARKPSAPTSLQATPGHPALRSCKVIAPSPERPQPVSGIASRKGQQQPWAVVSLRPHPDESAIGLPDLPSERRACSGGFHCAPGRDRLQIQFLGISPRAPKATAQPRRNAGQGGPPSTRRRQGRRSSCCQPGTAARPGAAGLVTYSSHGRRKPGSLGWLWPAPPVLAGNVRGHSLRRPTQSDRGGAPDACRAGGESVPAHPLSLKARLVSISTFPDSVPQPRAVQRAVGMLLVTHGRGTFAWGCSDLESSVDLRSCMILASGSPHRPWGPPGISPLPLWEGPRSHPSWPPSPGSLSHPTDWQMVMTQPKAPLSPVPPGFHAAPSEAHISASLGKFITTCEEA